MGWSGGIVPEQFRRVLLLVLIACAGAFLLFNKLSDIYLWQDEAETALVSRHLLAYGLPLSTDGVDWVQQSSQPFSEFTHVYVWIYHSWLQYWVTAAAFSVLGTTTLAARLPFALVGLVVLISWPVFLSRWLGDQRLAATGAVLLLFCVPFLLLMRQCRYYSLATLATLLVVDAYYLLRRGSPSAVPYLAASAVLLYHSHYGAFFPIVAGLGLHLALSRPSRTVLLRSILALGLAGLLILPWAVFMQVLNRGEPLRLDRFLAHLGQHTIYITGWILPLAVPILLVLAWRRLIRGWALTAAETSFCSITACLALTTVVMLSAAAAFDAVFFRYITHLIPLLLGLVAIVVSKVMARWPLGGLALLAALTLTNVVHMAPYGLPLVVRWDPGSVWPQSPAFQSLADVWRKAGRFRSDGWMYAQEMTHDYQGPNEGLGAYLADHAREGQTLVVNYEDLPLQFYTLLRVSGGLGTHGLEPDERPDWVVDRRNGPYRERLAAIVAGGDYRQVALPYPDIRWENRPQPGVHRYRTATDAPPVVLYRRIEE